MARKQISAQRIVLAFTATLLLTLIAAGPARAQYEAQKSGPGAVGVTSSTSISASTGDASPQKGSIKLDLQVDQDSSIYTKTVMVKLQNLNASEVEPFVQKSLSSYGAVSTNSQANLLVITDREPKLTDLVEFVKKMDALGIENFVRLETEVIHLNTAKASTLVAILNKRLSSDGTIQADDNLNVLVITDARGKIDIVKDIISQLDRPPQQFIIEAKIIQVFDTDFSDVGLDLSALLDQGILSFSSEKVSQKDWGASIPLTRSVRQKYSKTSVANYASEVVNIMLGSGKAKLIATPRIVTLNNQQGRMRVESGVYYDSKQGPFPDIELTATPNIGAGGLITIDFRAAAGLAVLTTPNPLENTAPSNSYRRSIESTILVHEGETFVVGGFNYDYTSSANRRTPLLSDIPFLGSMFKKKITYNNASQLLFFVTPVILKNQENPPTAEEINATEDN